MSAVVIHAPKDLRIDGFPDAALAVRPMGEGLLDVKPLISASLPFDSAVEAFELASDRARSMKVELTFA